ncbi:hypothetical protein CPC08DRAFT_756809 [Agrocybe pediades]|nr:hypothetical protein CPC08DRAFT_756809 [Agrocybe pediades]
MSTTRRPIIERIPLSDPPKIELTEVEQNICQLLNDCTASLAERGIATTCRIAGGWVRDKLLGSQSNDIDVALSNLMGEEFAGHLHEFAQSKGIQLGTIAKIEKNPEQSKHLETATMKVLGLDIDFVNLRSEEYAVGSRIPTGVRFGTPLEDALRRDITINALFYNVQTGLVEDFTEKGLDDLRQGTIRTPMPPKETFQDDPLRVLRCVRFASRFGFNVVQDLKDAAKDKTVQDALIAKVSRERVGDEVGKMIKGRDPLGAAELIHELALYRAIFGVMPAEVANSLPESFWDQTFSDALHAASILYILTNRHVSFEARPHPLLTSIVESDTGAKARLYLAALLVPYIDKTYQDQKKKIQPIVASAIRDSLKLGSQNHYLDGVPTLFASLPIVKKHLSDHQEVPLSRVKLGLLLRNKLVHNSATGSHWATSLLFALVTDLLAHFDAKTDSLTDDAQGVINRYNTFLDSVTDFGLQNDVDSKPLLNGREIGQAFGVSKPGPWVGKVLEDVIEWQLAHPHGTKDGCQEWLRSRTIDAYIAGEPETTNPSKRLRTK